MKKNNKLILLTLVILLLILVIVLFIIPNKDNSKNENKENKITNVTVSSKDIKDFEIITKGSYVGSITNEIIKNENIKLYEFDGTIFNGWEIKTDHYFGTKVTEILEFLNIKDFKEATFYSKDNKFVTYQKSEITDNTYLIFTKDDEDIPNIKKGTVLLLDFNKDYNYSIKSLSGIIFDKESISNEKGEKNEN